MKKQDNNKTNAARFNFPEKFCCKSQRDNTHQSRHYLQLLYIFKIKRSAK